MNWINVNKKLPEKTGEYNVVWNLNDGEYPVTTTMEYDAILKKWIDTRGCKEAKRNDILFWKNLPEPPKNINKDIYKK